MPLKLSLCEMKGRVCPSTIKGVVFRSPGNKVPLQPEISAKTVKKAITIPPRENKSPKAQQVFAHKPDDLMSSVARKTFAI